MNVPKAIRSLKSYFIRTTSHLCNDGRPTPLQWHDCSISIW